MRHGFLLLGGVCALVLVADAAWGQVVPLPGSPLIGTFPAPIAIREVETTGDPAINELLTVQLPGAVTPGFVVLVDPPFNNTDPLDWSDIVQFTGTQAILLSEVDTQPFPASVVADVLAGNHLFLREDREPVIYQATGAIYQITSDVEGVPEPGSLGLFALASIGLLRRRARCD